MTRLKICIGCGKDIDGPGHLELFVVHPPQVIFKRKTELYVTREYYHNIVCVVKKAKQDVEMVQNTLGVWKDVEVKIGEKQSDITRAEQLLADVHDELLEHFSASSLIKEIDVYFLRSKRRP